jgi:hypothetical protein
MARKATDLLDVFRPGGGGEGGSRPARPRPARAGAKMKQTGRGRFEGLVLTGRQIVLGSSVLVLLLVLSFTVGVGFGRGSRHATADRGLQATTAWYIRGRLTARDPLKGTPVVPKTVIDDLVGQYQLDRRLVSTLPRSDGGIWVFIGPFASEAEARRQFLDQGFEVAHVDGGTPFRNADYVQARSR